MNPDYTAMINDMVKPIFMLMMLVVTLFCVFVGYQLLKENQIYRRKLGKE